MAVLTPGRLRCEYRKDPVGIEVRRPRLSWRLESSDPSVRDQRQVGYQVWVGTEAGGADLWDSGQVESGRTNQVEYGGRELRSGEVAHWQVRAWSETGEVSGWSEVAKWSAGLLRAGDWGARWIGYDAVAPSEEEGIRGVEGLSIAGAKWIWTEASGAVVRGDTVQAAPAVYFRKTFTVPAGRGVRRVTALVTGEDGFDLYFNEVSRGGMVDKGKAKAVDLTPYVRTGENLIAIVVRKYADGAAGLVARVRVEFEDGGVQTLETDGSWVWSGGREGFERFGTDVSGWKPAVVVGIAGEAGRGVPEALSHELPPPPYLRKAFSIDKPVARATLYASALGAYQIRINGRDAHEDVLGPGWTEYSRRVYYRAYDVTALLATGENAIGALLGDGWYSSYFSYQGKRGLYGDEPRLLVQLEVEFADGGRTRVVSDGSWKAAYGAWRSADMLMGATYDARRELHGWDRAGFDDSGWEGVAVEGATLEEGGRLVWTFPPIGRALSPSGVHLEESKGAVSNVRRLEFAAHPADPVRRQGEVVAKSVSQPIPGTWVFDLGQNIVGWVRLRVRGEMSAEIRIEHAEMLNPDGTLYLTNLRAARATDTFVPRGEGEEVFEPVFTFHGFRYVAVTGLTVRPDLYTVTGIVVHTDLEQTGTFECSNDLVNGLVHNILWGQKGNHFEIPTDCPQRDERLGWTGDAQFFMRTGTYMMDVAAFFTKWLVDLIEDAQYPDGSFGSVAPDQNVGHGNTAWDDAAVICPWMLWQVYGDTRVIERHWPRMTRYIEFLQATSKGYIRGAGAYGDWVNLGGGAKSEVMGTAYSEHVTRLMAEMAGAIGRGEEARKYRLLADAIRAAFIHAFVKEDGAILESSQTGYALAFTMDLLPDGVRGKAAEKFVDDIAGHDYHLGTGFIGTPRLLPGLTAAGRADVAYRLLEQETFPSWLYQVKLGATTMWERWDGWTPEGGFQDPGMNSFNHYAFGSVGQWLFETVGGIRPMEPGFGRFRVRPVVGGKMRYARASYECVHGRIEVGWKVVGGRAELSVVVPVNTRAVVEVPGGERCEVGSGRYEFVGTA